MAHSSTFAVILIVFVLNNLCLASLVLTPHAANNRLAREEMALSTSHTSMQTQKARFGFEPCWLTSTCFHFGDGSCRVDDNCYDRKMCHEEKCRKRTDVAKETAEWAASVIEGITPPERRNLITIEVSGSRAAVEGMIGRLRNIESKSRNARSFIRSAVQHVRSVASAAENTFEELPAHSDYVRRAMAHLEDMANRMHTIIGDEAAMESDPWVLQLASDGATLAGGVADTLVEILPFFLL